MKRVCPPHKVGSKFVEESTPKFSAPKQEIKHKHPEPCRLGGIQGYRVVTLRGGVPLKVVCRETPYGAKTTYESSTDLSYASYWDFVAELPVHPHLKSLK